MVRPDDFLAELSQRAVGELSIRGLERTAILLAGPFGQGRSTSPMMSDGTGIQLLLRASLSRRAPLRGFRIHSVENRRIKEMGDNRESRVFGFS
jgi:hypothetical protein